MVWLYLLVLLLLGAIVLLLLGRLDGAQAPAEELASGSGDDVAELLRRAEGRPLDAADLEQVQFDSAVRGYRMDQVDELLDALAQQLRDQVRTPAEDDNPRV